MTEVLSEHNLVELEDLRDMLEVTDNIEERAFEYGGDTRTVVEYHEDSVDILRIVFGDRDEETGVADEYALTRESAEQLFKQVKLPPALLEAVPLEYTLPVLNWFLENQPGSLKALLVKDMSGKQKVAAFCRVGTEIYSSVDMLNTITSAMRDKYGITEVIANNVTHDLNFTNYTLLFPQTAEQIEGSSEVLVTGINVQSSVLGLKPTMLNGVVARDYHFNGMVSVTAVQQWNRKQSKSLGLEEALGDDGEGYDVYDWLAEAAAGLHMIRNNDIVNVKRLRKLSLVGHDAELMTDVFTKYSIPVGTRNLIRLSYAEQEDRTIYALWNAITEIANDDEVQGKPSLVRKLMEVGGELANHPESCASCHRLKDLE